MASQSVYGCGCASAMFMGVNKPSRRNQHRLRRYGRNSMQKKLACLLAFADCRTAVSRSSKPPKSSARFATRPAARCPKRPSRSPTRTRISRCATTTDENGNYDFFNVRVGRYTVTVEHAGFSKASATDIAVNVNARQRVDLTMQVGAVTESVRSHRRGRGARDRFERARAGHQYAPDRGTAAQRPQLFRPGAARDQRPPVADRRAAHHAARRRVQRQRHAQHLQQLPAGRRGQQRLLHQQSGLLEPGGAARRRTRSRNSR